MTDTILDITTEIIVNALLNHSQEILEGKLKVTAERAVAHLNAAGLLNASSPDHHEAHNELRNIDAALARRDALDSVEGRIPKILKTIERASDADRFERNWRKVLDAEHELSDAYVRLREILGALTIPIATSSHIWEITENRARSLVAENKRLFDIRDRVKEVIEEF